MAARHSLRRIVAFGLVGGVGFLVDGGLLWTLLLGDVSPYVARMISFPIAVLVTWWLNRTWTFHEADRSAPIAQLGRYLAVQITGALVNLAAYMTVIASLDATPLSAMLGFAIGSFLGMFINYFGARALAFT